MPTIQEAIRGQVESLVEVLLSTQNPRLLTALGISKQRRQYLKGGSKKLPATEAILAGLILLGKEIVIQGVFPANGSGAKQYSIIAVERREDGSASKPAQQMQLSLLAGLDFPNETTIERVEKKGPSRVELHLNVRVRA